MLDRECLSIEIRFAWAVSSWICNKAHAIFVLEALDLGLEHPHIKAGEVYLRLQVLIYLYYFSIILQEAQIIELSF